jgi:hypothetical protein
VLALHGSPISKQQLTADLGKNIYTKSCLAELKKTGAVKENTNGELVLHSQLFRAAILIHVLPKIKQKNAPPIFKKYLVEMEAVGRNPQN